jgi:YfiH family protein
MNPEWIEAAWPAPPSVRALTSTRCGGVSRGSYASLNLAEHVGDDPAAVRANRQGLREALGLPAEPMWLQQVHGCDVVELATAHAACAADASVARAPGQVCAVLSADCLPVLLCNRAGTRVAAAHAGWRGLLAGVIESALDAMRSDGEDVLCWLGPAIGPAAFEVGDEVRRAFVARDSGAQAAFRPASGGRWLADLYALARMRLQARRVLSVSGGEWCTVSDAQRFFSYRRDGASGRMASLIWIE